MEMESKVYPNLSTNNQPTAPSESSKDQPVVVVVENSQVCPACNQVNTMQYSDVVSTRQHLWFICLCLTCWCCAFIPYISTACMFNQERCRSCGFKTKDKTNNTGLIVFILIFAIINVIALILIVVFVTKHQRYVQETHEKFYRNPIPQWND